MKRPVALLIILVGVAMSSAVGTAPANAAALDGTCVASISLNFTPSVTQPLPPNSGPATTSTGSGTITTCVFPGGGATTGTLSYTLTGNVTCTSAQDVTGTLDITWSDNSQNARHRDRPAERRQRWRHRWPVRDRHLRTLHW